jgi:hypothetical protein
MNCPKCKSPIADDSQECEWCGFKITTKPKEKIGEINGYEEVPIVNPQVENNLIPETNSDNTSKSYATYIFVISIVVIIIIIFIKPNIGFKQEGVQEDVEEGVEEVYETPAIDSSSYYGKENGYGYSRDNNDSAVYEDEKNIESYPLPCNNHGSGISSYEVVVKSNYDVYVIEYFAEELLENGGRTDGVSQKTLVGNKKEDDIYIYEWDDFTGFKFENETIIPINNNDRD